MADPPSSRSVSFAAQESWEETWDSHRVSFEKYLEELHFSEEPRLASLVEAMRYSMLGGGKRVRPTLCMEVARVLGADPESVLPAAAAVELIHTYSLIHDDLPAMDDDDYRRGRLTTHKKYGEALAILSGDAFFGEAMTLITARQEGTADRRLAAVHALASATGVNGMVGGQVIDMMNTGSGSAADEQTLTLIHGFKTGALIRAAARMGAVLAGAEEERLAAVSEYASELGLCFQIVDDLLNATATPEELGKSAGSDAEKEKATFVGVYGVEGTRREADAALERALLALDRAFPGGEESGGLRGLATFVRNRGS
ncbi:MAG: polyprenyl synthetase family protein [Rubrobacter sp.]|nr:polyprenyl synthetase family protein [Rubrobacter sp.]